MKLCEKLQKIRKENNITQEGLADRLGVSIDIDYNEIKFYKDMINNLKMKKIVSYDKMFDIKMYISYDNLIMLRENLNNYNEYLWNG